MMTQTIGCLRCGQAVLPLTGGPDRHARFGWYVALMHVVDGSRVYAQLAVYAPEDTRESALIRARLLLEGCPQLAEYRDWTPLPTTQDGLTSRGGDIEVYKKPEGIA